MDEREDFVIRQDEAFKIKKDRNSHSANIDRYQFIWKHVAAWRMTDAWRVSGSDSGSGRSVLDITFKII